MLTPIEAFETILGLVEINAWDIFDEVTRKHPADFPEQNHSLYRRIGESIRAVLHEYDYTTSPEFAAGVEGKSEAVVAMKARFQAEPVKRSLHRQQLADALHELPGSRRAYDLVHPSMHLHLDRIVRDIEALRTRNVG
jgi:hypothetical protein